MFAFGYPFGMKCIKTNLFSGSRIYESEYRMSIVSRSVSFLNSVSLYETDSRSDSGSTLLMIFDFRIEILQKIFRTN